ncbi:sensor histidine kinase [Sphingomonas aerophila]|uniref:histidine kinase n=1 Tax=Sphingomonas aerophila TaxID=1344948 RepID=A0A7W9BF61_9SPHN|nr:PAS domain-containing protein [Sphingomonas aerophila]MBB5716041.1 PAS domain S-box-containing protein [Sphingomonas aerophila]
MSALVDRIAPPPATKVIVPQSRRELHEYNPPAVPDATIEDVIEHDAECVTTLTLDGRVRGINRVGCRLMEFADPAEVSGRAWRDLWPVEARMTIDDAFRRAVAGEAVRFDLARPSPAMPDRWWETTITSIEDGRGQPVAFIAASRDITDRMQALQAMQAVVEEMQHRLKNTYAVASGMVSAFARGAPEREAFAEEMASRLAALGTAQQLYHREDRERRPIAQLVPTLVASFATPACPIVARHLPGTLDHGQADAVALVLGELAVNSTKHGALSGMGAINVTSEDRGGRVEIRWSERGSRRVAATVRDGGQGMTLMRRIVAARRGSLDMQWKAYGLTAIIGFPKASIR